MRRLFAVLVAAGLASGGSLGDAHADARLKDPFAKPAESESVRALAPARLKDPFAKPATPKAVETLREARLKDPFARPDRPEELPNRSLKNPFAR